eukprot:CAMPEP_0181305930 /NCGR_PEP_ID=MMETSP1101-20121128/10012_1 /TAXON_ID=46948 /ORGANISM="Rhodomonas abbreviata, Strain Caron Lab Isolate" /LENGTH=393 /DNA_ID=CAMNT_0023411919 /DNA_START=222 /DNA_END=1403 /DNA_ORIENTATION=-
MARMGRDILAFFVFKFVAVVATVTWMDHTQEMRDWCVSKDCNPSASYSLVIGETVTFNMTAIHNDPSKNVTIAILANPGLPSDCSVTGVNFLEYMNVSNVWHLASQRRLTFQPSINQEGLTFQVCFEAYDTSDSGDKVGRCVQLIVKAPQPAFHNLTDSVMAHRAVGVNCPVNLKVVAYDKGERGYCMTVRPGKIGANDIEMPHGSQLRLSSTSAVPKHGDFDGCAHTEYHILWYPRRGQEGRSYTFCAHVGDSFCTGRRVCVERQVEICYEITVVKCQYCLAAGETIMAAAARYKTDWLQLWAANSHLKAPDTLPAYQPLTLGPMYAVRPSDTLQSLATRFGTTATNILDANPDVDLVDNKATIVPGDHICILPWVCLTEAESAAAGAYIVN